MSREIKNDYNKLIEFIENYSLSSQATDSDFKKCLTQLHKKYYSVLAFVLELDALVDDTGNKVFKDKQRDYILESISDIGNAVFLLINGAYKPAKLVLRSSIETFLKGIAIVSLTDIDKEKKIYQMFDRIAEIDFFKNDPTNKIFFNQLISFYSELSKDIHTAGNNHMQHTSSLNYFPTISIQRLEGATSTLSQISQIILTILTIKFNDEFHKMHHENKAIIIKGIKKKYRKRIHNIEE